jgi:hypothetical protein
VTLNRHHNHYLQPSRVQGGVNVELLFADGQD